MWDCWLHCRRWLGPGDGIRDSELREDVESFYESVVRRARAAIVRRNEGFTVLSNKRSA